MHVGTGRVNLDLMKKQKANKPLEQKDQTRLERRVDRRHDWAEPVADI